MKPSLRDLPIVLISAWQGFSHRISPNCDIWILPRQLQQPRSSRRRKWRARPRLCFTPGYYTVSFSAFGEIDVNQGPNQYLEQKWIAAWWNFLECVYVWKIPRNLHRSDWLPHCGEQPLRTVWVKVAKSTFLHILHMDAGALNTKLTGLGFDLLV